MVTDKNNCVSTVKIVGTVVFPVQLGWEQTNNMNCRVKNVGTMATVRGNFLNYGEKIFEPNMPPP